MIIYDMITINYKFAGGFAMLRSKKIVLLSICCLVLVSLVAQVFATNDSTADTKLMLEKYRQKDEVEIKKQLKELSKEQLIEDANSLSTELEKATDINVLIPFAQEIFKRKDEFKNTEILEVIQNNTYSPTTQQVMVDLFTVKNENNLSKNELKKLLKENTVRKDVKVKIVANSRFNKDDVTLLRDLFKEDNGVLAFMSLKKLSNTNSEEAYKIAKKVLSNYKSESEEKVSASLKATVKYLKSNKLDNKELAGLENDFINLNLQIVNTTNDNSLKDSSIFALSELMSKASIDEIIKNESIDRELKVFAVDQNFMVLKEILSKNPTEADVELVVKAMEILPISDLIANLEIVAESIENKDLLKRCNDVLKNMRLNGLKGNQKWLDK